MRRAEKNDIPSLEKTYTDASIFLDEERIPLPEGGFPGTERLNEYVEDGTLVAGSEHGDAYGLVDETVLKVIGTDTLAGSKVCAGRLLEEIAPRQWTTDSGEEVLLADRFLFAR